MALIKDKQYDLPSVESFGLEIVLDGLRGGKDNLMFFIQLFPLFCGELPGYF